MLSLGTGLCRFTIYLQTDCMPLILEDTRNWVGKGYRSQRNLEKFPACRTHPTIWMQGQHFYVCNAYAAVGLIGYSQRIHFLRNFVCKHVSLWIFNFVLFLFQSLCQSSLDWRWCFVLKRRKLFNTAHVAYRVLGVCPLGVMLTWRLGIAEGICLWTHCSQQGPIPTQGF
jgi:hypothetical protein